MDGFRFILARDAGHLMLSPPVIWAIESAPLPGARNCSPRHGMPHCTGAAMRAGNCRLSSIGGSVPLPVDFAFRLYSSFCPFIFKHSVLHCGLFL
jgi:hypothetical protein